MRFDWAKSPLMAAAFSDSWRQAEALELQVFFDRAIPMLNGDPAIPRPPQDDARVE
jgi:hypothetical protein